jgi:IclR family acetate operon transcriptional repressor
VRNKDCTMRNQRGDNMEFDADDDLGSREVRGAATARRACEMLECVVAPGSAKSLDKLSQMTGFNRSTAYRILRTLESAGFVRHETDRGGYLVGPRLVGLAATTMHEIGRQAITYAALERLTEITKETAVLSMRCGDSRVSVAGSESTAYALRRRLMIGEVFPLDSGSAAKAILAFLDEGVQVEVLHRLGADTAATGAIRVELTAIRAQGYAISKGENHSGIAGIAVPVIKDAAPVGSIACGGPHDRWTEARMIDALGAMQTAAEEIAGRI